MLSSPKIFATTVFAALVFSNPAYAGFVDCWRKLTAEPEKAAAPRTRMTVSERMMTDPLYLDFLALQVRDPSARPPRLPITAETKKSDLLYGFGYWWHKENSWYAAMMPLYGERGGWTRMSEEELNEHGITPADIADALAPEVVEVVPDDTSLPKAVATKEALTSKDTDNIVDRMNSHPDTPNAAGDPLNSGVNMGFTAMPDSSFTPD